MDGRWERRKESKVWLKLVEGNLGVKNLDGSKWERRLDEEVRWRKMRKKERKLEKKIS